MLPIDGSLLRLMFPNAGSRLDPHLPYINPALEWGKIDTPKRVAAFLAQLGHESGEYRWMEEIADGSAYEGRADLGNIHPGDGVKYKGHGPIQVTGRDNHARCGAALGLDLINFPKLICLPQYGTLAAAWFWNDKRLSPLADIDWFPEITRRVNGGYTHFAERVKYWERNRGVLGLPSPPPLSTTGSSLMIREFQENEGLDADGLIGPRTKAAVKRAYGVEL